MTDDCMGCRVPGYSHAAYCPEDRVEELRSLLADAQVAYVARGMELRDAEDRLAEAEALLREARMGVKNSAVQFGYPYTEYVDRIDAFLAPDSSRGDDE